MGLRKNLVNVILADLPTPDSKLEEPNPRWDEILGGKRGPGRWGRYSNGYGTTCIITANGWGIDAGLPDDMLVKEDTPNGGGTKIHQAMITGAKARGWYRTPTRGQLPDLRPGDIYVSNKSRPDGIDGTHMGVILRFTPAADGQSAEVETADGGQGDKGHQQAGRSIRTFRVSSGARPVTISSKSGESWLEHWFAIGGDEADEDADSAASGGGGSDLGTAAIFGIAGLALIAGAYYLSTRPSRMNELRTFDDVIYEQQRLRMHRPLYMPHRGV